MFFPQCTELSPPTPVVVWRPNMFIRLRVRPIAYAPNPSPLNRYQVSTSQRWSTKYAALSQLSLSQGWNTFSSQSGEINNSDLVELSETWAITAAKAAELLWFNIIILFTAVMLFYLGIRKIKWKGRYRKHNKIWCWSPLCRTVDRTWKLWW